MAPALPHLGMPIVRQATSFVPPGTVHQWTVPGAGAVPYTRRSPMSAATSLSGASLTAVQQQFTATLSAVEDAVKFAFRKRLRPQEYEDALAEARAAAWSAW